jgi:5,10-methylene-tetrahydrofolate dehydrogenase/methenyl tetrahydrofolate cyclohydrolase
LFWFFSSFIGSFGLIILIVTLIIKMVLFPVTWKNFLSSAKMRVLKPEIDEINKKFEGKEAVVLGRSNIVGIPVALLLMQRNATVTIAHSRTKNLEETIRRADIVVAAVGRAEMVKGAWIKPGAVVIDVGINSVDDASDKRGYLTYSGYS